MKKNLWNISLFGLLLIFVLGCNTITQVKKAVEESNKPEVVISNEGFSQITIPGNWDPKLKLDESYTIQTGNLFKEQYLAVISDAKIDYTDDLDLNGYVELIRQNIEGTVEKLNISEAKMITVNGLEAQQFEVSGEVEKLKISYIYTLVNGKNHFHQVVTWTLTSKFEQNKNTFLETTNTFKETGERDSKINVPQQNSEN